MLPYLGVFFASSSLIALSEKIKKNQRLFFVILALALPCMLAGFRADHIGTDTEVYLMPTINAATSSHSFSEYLNTSWYRIWRFLSVKDFERGFTLVVYITTKLLGAFWTKSILEMLTIAPTYLAIKKYGKYPAWLGMMVFYLTTYNSTLNMMRQSIAVAFTLLGILYFIERNKKGFVTCLLVGCSFHTSGVVLLLIAAMFYFIKPKQQLDTLFSRRVELQKVALILVLGIASLFSLGLVSSILKIIGLGSYVNYFGGTFHFVQNQFLNRFPIMLFILISWNKWNEGESYARFFIAMFILEVLCLQLISVNVYSGRIAYFFSSVNVLAYPSLCYCRPQKGRRFLMISALLAYLLLYWWFYYGIKGIDATIPYVMI